MTSLIIVGLTLSISACSTKKADPPGDTPDVATAEPGPPPSLSPTKNTTARANIGAQAPDFVLTSLAGKEVKLSDHRGKIVVLEWFNPDCPFVRQSHNNGTLKGMATRHPGVVWLAINSGAPGEQGNGKAANNAGKTKFGITYPILIDEDGKIGQLYGAERTPHMYVIDTEGVLVYAGAIDSSGGGDIGDVPDLENHVANAIEDVKAATKVRLAETKAWGCSVKYAK